jgi:outer membrane receptor protein involved in Fe transport
MRTINRTDGNWASIEAGSFGGRRAAAGLTVPGPLAGNITAVVQAKTYDGPWGEPEHLRHLSALVKYTAPVGTGDFGLSWQGYDATWRPTEQVPERIVGTLVCPDEFCSPDPTARGKTTRHIVNAVYEAGPLRANAYAQYYDFRMTSNPVYANPDGSSAQIEQFDNRWIFGSNVSWQTPEMGPFRPSVGAEMRYDLIRNVGVATTGGGGNYQSLGSFQVGEGSVGSYAQATIEPLDGLRLTGGLRGDFYWYSVSARDAAAAALGVGRGSKSVASPKVSVAYQPADWLEFYANYGEGFHSNDVRGAVTATPVPLLSKGRGKELGARIQVNSFTLTATYWWLDLGSELRFVGDSNSVEPTGASRRRGYEVVAFWHPLLWLAIDANFTDSRSRYDNGDFIPNAFENAGQIGFSLVQKRWELSARLRHLGPYPLLEDNSQRDKGSNVVNVRGALKFKRFEIVGEALNALNSHDKDIAYWYGSYVPAVDARSIEGRVSRVVEPRTVRIGLRVKLGKYTD